MSERKIKKTKHKIDDPLPFPFLSKTGDYTVVAGYWERGEYMYSGIFPFKPELLAGTPPLYI